MINFGTFNKLRRFALRDGVSVRQASLRLGISRNTATKWLSEPEIVEPQYPVRQTAPSVLEPYKKQLVTWLKADSHRNKRERRGIKALFEALRAMFCCCRIPLAHLKTLRLPGPLAHEVRNSKFWPLLHSGGGAKR